MYTVTQTNSLMHAPGHIVLSSRNPNAAGEPPSTSPAGNAPGSPTPGGPAAANGGPGGAAGLNGTSRSVTRSGTLHPPEPNTLRMHLQPIGKHNHSVLRSAKR